MDEMILPPVNPKLMDNDQFAKIRIKIGVFLFL